MRYSDILLDYNGANPFRDSQAKMYGDERIASEFFPTSTYWSLFNEQHEILLGTRGSGKTVLLRMLSYSCLRHFNSISDDKRSSNIIDNKAYIGFYIPMHLEFAASLPEVSANPEVAEHYFNFAFNCTAASALLKQIPYLLKDCTGSSLELLECQSKIIDLIKKFWFPSYEQEISSIKEIEYIISNMYSVTTPGQIVKGADQNMFCKPILRPILHVLPFITTALGLPEGKTKWLACIDEAEFLQETYLKCINSYLRDEKSPLIVKMATLPLKHTTRETTYEATCVEPNGNDFNYRCVDLPWDSNDFSHLSNHILNTRLRKTGLEIPILALHEFVGTVGRDETIDYFKAEIVGKEEDVDDESMIMSIVAELGETRQAHFEGMKDNRDKYKQSIEKKFRPIFMMRVMKREDSKGNRTVGWFAGATTILRIADGNPRTFIQVMNLLLDEARERKLTAKNQHRALVKYCQRRTDSSEALPLHGVTAKVFIEAVCNKLSSATHDGSMVDSSGCHFMVTESLLEDAVLYETIAVAVGHSHIVVDDYSKMHGLSKESDCRLSYSYCVHYWIPMRRGNPPNISATQKSLFANKQTSSTPTTKTSAREHISQLMLDFSLNTESESEYD